MAACWCRAPDRTLKLWEVQSGKCLRTLEGHSNWVQACDFSPDGRLLVSGSDDRTLKLWEVQSGKCLRMLEGHGGVVRTCDFSPDGRLLVSGSDDGTLKLWEVETGEVCLTLVNAPHGQTAALDERHNRILAASPEAWRYLGWRYFDAQADRLRILPAEHFGPLPS
jgi:WD40 repeat protein